MTSGHKRLLSCGAGSIALVAALAVLYTPALPEFIPTLDGGNLAGQLSSDDIVVFTAAEAEAGIDIPANRHVVFSCGERAPFPLRSGALRTDEVSRYWMYEYSGQEPEALGAFFVSPGELAINPGYASIDTLRELSGDRRYYLMSAVPLRFQCGVGLSKPEQCGNDILEGTEECDVLHEGCDQLTCRSKPGFVCENNACRIFIPTLGGGSSSGGRSSSSNSSSIYDTTHMECRGNACTVVFGPGTNQCTTSADCGGSSSARNSSSTGNASSAQPTVILHSASISNARLTLVYSKNFDTCAHVYGRQGLIDHRINFICGTGDNLSATASFADMGVSFTAGQEIKICHGNNGNICSGFVTISGANALVGNLFVIRDSTPVRNRQLLGGALGEAVMRLEFRAEQENIEVLSLHISADGDPSSIDRLELYTVGAAAPFATATRGACGAGSTEFCAEMTGGQLIVAQGQSVDVIVRPRIKSDTDGSVSGQEIKLALAAGNAGTPASLYSVRARGMVSNQELHHNNGDGKAEAEVIIGRNTPGVGIDILAPVHVVVHSKIALISNANPDANGTSVPTGVSPIGQFRFQAAAHTNTRNGLNDVVIGGIIFDVAAANVAVSAGDFRIYDKRDATMKHQCFTYYTDGTPFTAAQISGTFYVECNSMVNSAISTIDANANSTLVLEANILSPALNAAAPSKLQVSIGNFASMTNAYGLDTPSMSHFYWTDRDAGGQVDFAWVEHGDTVITSTVYQN